MDKIFKQSTTWFGVACLVAAIVFAITGSALHPGCKLVNDLQKGMDKKDGQAIAECFAPDAQEEVILYFSMNNLLTDSVDTNLELYFAGYEESEPADESGEETEASKKIRAIFVEKSGLTVTDVYSDKLEIVEVDKKEYFKY